MFVTRISPERQTSRDTFVYYDENKEKTIMQFVKPLVEECECSILEESINIFLYKRAGSKLGSITMQRKCSR